MYGKVKSACLQGIEGKLIDVEVDISNGLPQINLVGLPDLAIRESIERVRAAIKNCGFQFPMDRITVNLAPADLRKEGSSFDLAIAMAILFTSKQIQNDFIHECLFIGELALDGTLRAIPGVLSMVHAAKLENIKTVFVPLENYAEAKLIKDIQIEGITHISTIFKTMEPSLYSNIQEIQSNKVTYANVNSTRSKTTVLDEDYLDVKGQIQVKRAMMIAAAGYHNILMIGPPGTGKTMLVRRLASILPLLTEEEQLEVTKIYSVAKYHNENLGLIQRRPFRSPHHSISPGGLVGGGSSPRPGEISLAHKGVLFLDELPEFSSKVLELLRQPIESGTITLSRARANYMFPCQFILAAAMNPCPCGYYGSMNNSHECMCTPTKIKKYRSKISGPLLDRIDLQVEVSQPKYNELIEFSPSLSSFEMKNFVLLAYEIQKKRYEKLPIQFNSELQGKSLEQFASLNQEGNVILQHAFEQRGLSPRAKDRIIRISRTIADLDNSEQIQTTHLIEAINYRNLDQMMS